MSQISLAVLSIPVAAYLLGSIPFGLLLTGLFGAGDVRKSGSGTSAPPTSRVLPARCLESSRWSSTSEKARQPFGWQVA
jgi:hypothetical protein